nr:hypothetical protein Iba_chr02bCG8410 [Ipomoea batatas]
MEMGGYGCLKSVTTATAFDVLKDYLGLVELPSSSVSDQSYVEPSPHAGALPLLQLPPLPSLLCSARRNRGRRLPLACRASMVRRRRSRRSMLLLAAMDGRETKNKLEIALYRRRQDHTTRLSGERR